MALLEWSVADLDPNKMFEVRYSQNPETSLRFSLPVPRWLDEASNVREELKSSIIDEKDAKSPDVKKNGIFWDSKKKSWRFAFYNYEDQSDQAVKVDATGSVIFTEPTPGQARDLFKIIAETVGDLSAMTPNHLVMILRKAHEMGITDIYHSDQGDINKRMHAYNPDAEDRLPYLGPYLMKPDIRSTCIFISGQGVYNGPILQKFEDGAFIEFSGKSLDEMKRIMKGLKHEHGLQMGRLLQKKVFYHSRLHPTEDRPYEYNEVPRQKDQIRRFMIPGPIAGIVEYSPELHDVQRHWKETIFKWFDLHGYTNHETSHVEETRVLCGNGDDKEIYALAYLNAEDGKDPRTEYGLRFDHTTGLARYVAQNHSQLTFPFKRSVIGRVFRGDKPGLGRKREFYQCDIDVLDRGELSLEFDAEMPIIMHDIVNDLGLSQLGLGSIVICISNRKIMQGFCEGLGLDDDQIKATMRALDKIDKPNAEDGGEEGVYRKLTEDERIRPSIVEQCIALAKIRATGSDIVRHVMALGVDTPVLQEGLNELAFVLRRLENLPEGSVIADMSIARGLEYYTGTVYETKCPQHPDFPSILSGGRYDNLVGRYLPNAHIPGVGISFGLTRVFSMMHDRGMIQPGRKSPTDILITVPNEQWMPKAKSIADNLRQRGVCTEVYHNAHTRRNEQIGYANKRGIPYVLLIGDEFPVPELKDMNARTQEAVDISIWQPAKLKRA